MSFDGALGPCGAGRVARAVEERVRGGMSVGVQKARSQSLNNFEKTKKWKMKILIQARYVEY